MISQMTNVEKGKDTTFPEYRYDQKGNGFVTLVKLLEKAKSQHPPLVSQQQSNVQNDTGPTYLLSRFERGVEWNVGDGKWNEPENIFGNGSSAGLGVEYV
jgi:hypothetical protein